MAEGTQSPRMRTRAQGRVTHTHAGDGQLEGGTSGEISTDQQERSSLNQEAADIMSAQTETGFLNMEEPVI